MIVDDHREIRDALKRYLEHNGMLADAVENATTMDRALAGGEYDLIILDIVMPGEDGLSVCRRLRSGPGIREADRERVFEPFVRLEISRSRNTGGSGLGLSIAGTVIESHGGSVTLEQAPAGGSRAVILWPAL